MDLFDRITNQVMRLVESMLTRMVRIGTVTAVNNDDRKVRVKFRNLEYTSGWLTVIANQPFIPDYDVPQRTEYESGGSDAAAFENHKHDLIIKPWMPVINQTVLCIYLTGRNGDGFVIGGV